LSFYKTLAWCPPPSSITVVTKVLLKNVREEEGRAVLFPLFKFEAKKDGLEHASEKLYPVQNVGNLLPFLPQFTEDENILPCRRS